MILNSAESIVSSAGTALDVSLRSNSFCCLLVFWLKHSHRIQVSARANQSIVRLPSRQTDSLTHDSGRVADDADDHDASPDAGACDSGARLGYGIRRCQTRLHGVLCRLQHDPHVFLPRQSRREVFLARLAGPPRTSTRRGAKWWMVLVQASERAVVVVDPADRLGPLLNGDVDALPRSC